jgi:hypothetical protein
VLGLACMVLASRKRRNQVYEWIYIDGMVTSVVTECLIEVLEDNMRGLRSVIAPLKMGRQNHFSNPWSPKIYIWQLSWECFVCIICHLWFEYHVKYSFFLSVYKTWRVEILSLVCLQVAYHCYSCTCELQVAVIVEDNLLL